MTTEHTISTITSELVAHGIPRWDIPEGGGGQVPSTAWWLFTPDGEAERSQLHICGKGHGGTDWQLEVGYCPECGEVIDTLVIEAYCGFEVASLEFWPGLSTAVGFALMTLALWETDCERSEG